MHFYFLNTRFLSTMRINSIVFLIFFYSTATFLGVAPDKLDDLLAAVKDSKITSKPITNYLSTVFINDQKYIVSVYDTIYVGRPITEKGEYHDNTLSKLYTCISCEMAIWTVNELYRFLEPFLLKQNALFLSVQNNIFGMNYNILVHILEEIRKNVDRFINILLNFMNINAYGKYYDTNLLKTLLSLHFKIDFIKTLGDCYRTSEAKQKGVEKSVKNDDEISEYDSDGVDDFDGFENVDEPKIKGFDDVVLRLTYQTINSIRNFMVLNCNFPRSFDDIDAYDVFFVSKTASTNDDKIAKFLADIEQFGLESLKSCSAREMLLLETNVWIWNGIEWKTTGGKLRVENVVKRIEVCYDLETIHWYQEMIFKTMMKIILSKIQKHDEIFPESVLRLFKEVYNQLILDFHKLPTLIVEIFTVLNEYDGTKHNDLLAKIAEYIGSVSEIQLCTSAKNKLLRLPLENLLDLVLKNVDSVRCFIRVFDFLRYEHGKYYLPFKKDVSIIDSFVRIAANESIENGICPSIGRGIRTAIVERVEKNRMLLDDAGCVFVQGMNHYCLMALFSLNNRHVNFLDINNQFHQDITFNLKKIYDFLIQLLNGNYWHVPLFNVLHRAIQMLEIHVMISNDIMKTHDYYLRLVYAVITEFNEYGLLHCRLPEFNFGHYSMHLGLMGRISLVNAKIDTALQRIIFFGKINDPYQYFDISRFFTKQNVFASYERKIFFSWKSEKKSIAYICECVRSTVMRSFNSYEFYDVYVKFVMALAFYEMDLLYDKLRSDYFAEVEDDYGEEIAEIFRYLQGMYRIPDDYKTILFSMREFSELAFNKAFRNDNKEGWIQGGNGLQQQIIERFDRAGVSFEFAYDTIVNRVVEKCLDDIFVLVGHMLVPLTGLEF